MFVLTYKGYRVYKGLDHEERLQPLHKKILDVVGEVTEEFNLQELQNILERRYSYKDISATMQELIRMKRVEKKTIEDPYH